MGYDVGARNYWPIFVWYRTCGTHSNSYLRAVCWGMLDNVLVSKLQNCPGYNQRTWLQQDGATSSSSNRFLPCMREILPCKLISRRGDINWPQCSPDLTAINFFLWVMSKENFTSTNRLPCRAVRSNFSATDYI